MALFVLSYFHLMLEIYGLPLLWHREKPERLPSQGQTVGTEDNILRNKQGQLRNITLEEGQTNEKLTFVQKHHNV